MRTKKEKLSELAKMAKMCVRCNYCSPCPTYRVDGWESISPRGKLQLIRDVAAGNVSIDAKIVKDIYKCSVCGLCEVLCPVDLPLLDLWEALRSDFVNKKVAPLSMHRKLRESTFRNMNPYGEEQERRGDWIEFEVDNESNNLYFAGCTASFKLQGLAKSTASMLKKLGIDFSYAGKNEVCCGSPFLRTGQRDIVERLFMRNYKVWQRMKIGTIITSCPGCYRTIARDYPKLAEEKRLEFDINVVHTVSILDECLKEIGSSGSVKATYHDPCHLGRHMGVYDAPRNVIKKLGIELVEMERSRDRSLCCGAGGGLRSQFKEISFEIGHERVEEAISTGAELLITCCPFCEYHLSKSAEKLGNKIRVVDLVELANTMI